jgi:signal transduction histidine kinase
MKYSSPFWQFAATIWFLGTVLGTAWQMNRVVESSQAQAQAAFDNAFLRVTQRLDQNEALLDGLVALLQSSGNKEFPELRQYAEEMLRRYPHLYTIGYQPRVEHEQRALFEQRLSARFARSLQIRDFSFDGARSWRVSPTRERYFPVTFMAPELLQAQDVMGYDVYQDRQTKEAVDRSAATDQAVAAPPFDLVEGGRGYIFLRALRLATDNEPSLSETPNHLISLLVHADKILAGIPLPAHATLVLRQLTAENAANQLIGQVQGSDTPQTDPWTVKVFPLLRLSRVNPSANQPMELEIRLQPQWNDMAWNSWGVFMTIWSLVVIVVTMWISSLQRSRQQAGLVRKDLEAAERRAETNRKQSLGELGAGFAHELTQPLTAVVGYSQAGLRLLGTSHAPSAQTLDEVRRTLQSNARQALRAGELLQKLRALVQANIVHRQTLVIQDVLANALRMEQPRMQTYGITTTVAAPQLPIYLEGDAMLLEQVLSNLLRNATDALQDHPPTKRHVWIDLSRTDDQCQLAIRDDGPGMTDDQLARAFHPFQSTKPNGLGMGLVVCASIIQAHGGTMYADRAENGGACFTVALPLRHPSVSLSPSQLPP